MSSQRVVVITGGNSGMGQATAAAFARANERVVIIGRSEERLRATAQELGTNVTWLKADVSQRSHFPWTRPNACGTRWLIRI